MNDSISGGGRDKQVGGGGHDSVNGHAGEGARAVGWRQGVEVCG